ncbi:hypothetical protein C4J96_0185 [Pseudomonas orientalis]|uniref:hypothetical protein n=1 Tax=Pseudomonas orientalis TaxID=76758 RepID=UPI000F589729|nr:hypothetical protein [Pseudomonas orientalis]AZE92336.1 hypothetical protein C4J96_0185 [Pseudomonas orientalis]
MRYKWLNVEWPVHIAQLASRMKSLNFISNEHHGFVIDKVRDGLIEARYIEKVYFTDLIVDPFGNETTFDRIEYRESAFRITQAPPTLELINAPRSPQALLNRLSEITDFEASIEQLQVDVISWADELIKTIDGAGSFDSMQISKLELGNKTFAKILVTGEQDIKEVSALLVGGRRHVVEKVRIRLHNPLKGSIVLSGSGAATINSSDFECDIVQALKSSLNVAL